MNTITLTKTKRDINGNPRVIVHFLDLLSKQELDRFQKDYQNPWNTAAHRIDAEYNLALSKAKLIGGRAYRGKDFGGGIVFQSYNDRELIQDIAKFARDKDLIDWCNLPSKGYKKFSRSRDNLSYDPSTGQVFSYTTHVAQIIGDYLVARDKHYSVTTSKHISIAAHELGLKRVTELEYYNLYQ
jgi:hypothetical protein